MPKFTLQELCEKLGEPFEGDGSIQIMGVAEIDSAKEGEISFVANPKYVAKIPICRASALIVHKDLDTDFRPVIRSSNPYLTFTQALYLFHKDQRKLSGGIHPSCHVDPSVQLGEDITIMPHVIVERGAVIGDRSILYPGVFVGEGAVIGNDVTLYPNVSIYAGCRVGDQSILHAGCRIGPINIQPAAEKPPVVLNDDVELGANVVISGQSESPTVIGQGVKIDNLVQIGAGTQVGPHCIIVAQVAIGDHVTLGERVTIAGQVVVSPGVTIGEKAQVGAKSVVMDDIPPCAVFWGVPAQAFSKEKRLKANIARLPKMFDKIQHIEDHLSELES
ncbi:MAG: UDP-3-O-(3-hydroxymyristoyl)glucosamine N-acyltransferase [Candidatus Omnitrophica bacterium]|nr:UDP-3-O-(3-hydroxymyristoyl)glucosamine N-acyltransferase [Candidatus Omnitrophota bacterium]